MLGVRHVGRAGCPENGCPQQLRQAQKDLSAMGLHFPCRSFPKAPFRMEGLGALSIHGSAVATSPQTRALGSEPRNGMS